MGCSCITVDYDDGPEFYSEYNVKKARKDHHCCECRGTIKKGDSYEVIAGMWEGDFQIYKTCLDCQSIRKEFFCGGAFVFGEILNDLKESLYYAWDVDLCCLNGLTPGARDRVMGILDTLAAERGEEL